jgi:Icc-related predicted phosphoesterase
MEQPIESPLSREVVRAAFHAVDIGDLDTLRQLTQSPSVAPWLTLRYHKETLLYRAATANKPSILTFLLDLGADPDLQSTKVRRTALHGACWHGPSECVKILLQRGARIDIKNDYGDTPRDDAITKGFHNIVNMIENSEKSDNNNNNNNNNNNKNTSAMVLAIPETAVPGTVAENVESENVDQLEVKKMMQAQPQRIKLEKVGHCLQAPDVILRPNATRKLRVVCISDTHDHLHDLSKLRVPPGDILIHCGDFTNRGLADEWDRFRSFMRELPHQHKVIICGNHDYGVDNMSHADVQSKIFPDFIYLQDSSCTIEGIKFYGTPANGHFMAFCVGHHDSEKMYAKFNEIPADTDILLSHIPPHNILDLAWVKKLDPEGQVCEVCGQVHRSFVHWGSVALRQRIMATVKPKIHVFGHVHDAQGAAMVPGCPTLFINAAMDLNPKPISFDVYL